MADEIVIPEEDKMFIDPNVNDGYPSFGKPFPEITMELKNNMAIYASINDSYPSFGKEFPEMNDEIRNIMFINPDYNDSYPSFLKQFVDSDALPYSIMRNNNDYNDNYPNFAREFTNFGCFKDAENLETVTIPQSVSDISDYAFTGTKIKEVTISPDCNYYPNSFPPGTKIKNY